MRNCHELRSGVPQNAGCYTRQTAEVSEDFGSLARERHMRIHWLPLTALLLLMMTAGSGLTHSADAPPMFKITSMRDTDNVVVTVEQQKTFFDIHSPFGISHVIIGRRGAEWPESMVLRLHLTGLESFQLNNGETTLHASVSSQGGDKPVRLWKNDEEDKPLDSTSPVWTKIRLIGSDGKPTQTIPLKDGYFEIEIPKALREGNPQSITVSWIDFYRN